MILTNMWFLTAAITKTMATTNAEVAYQFLEYSKYYDMIYLPNLFLDMA